MPVRAPSAPTYWPVRPDLTRAAVSGVLSPVDSGETLMRHAIRIGIFGAFVLAMAAPQAMAVPITYTVSGHGSGVLGTSTFNHALVTVRFDADTDNVVVGFMAS